MNRYFVIKIIYSSFLILSILLPNALPFSAKYAAAQAVQVGGGASVGTGFQAGGIIASAISCSGVIDKLTGAIAGLLNFNVTEVAVGDAGLRTKENCMDALVHQLVVKILDKITLATVDWINSGFEGKPLYLSDPEEFFANVARQEIDSLTGWYGCTVATVNCNLNYPFGQLVMGSIISTIQSQLAANVQFSLNQVLAHGTYEEFRWNFNVGGWAGYTALFSANNNPFGNSLLVNRELGRRIGGTSITVSRNFSEQLTQSGGFLNQRKCTLTATGDVDDYYIPATDELHIPPGGAVPEAAYTAIGYNPDLNTPMTEAQALSLEELKLRSQCRQWQTTTPGNVIAGKLNSALNISDNKLIQADEISESLGLIFDALINQLAGQGLEALGSIVNGEGSGGSSSVLVQQVNGQQPGQVTNNQVPPPVIDAVTGTGFVDVPLVVVQQDYINAANVAIPVLNDLVLKIRALDYCVPGPNPNWLEDAQENFQNILLSVAPFSSTNPDPQEAADENRTYYAGAINTITGINVVENASMQNHTQFLAFMNNLFTKYAEKMQNTTDLGYQRFLAPPATRALLQNLLEDAESYQASYEVLTNFVTNIPTYLPILMDIEEAFDQIGQDNNGVIDPSNPQVQAQVSIFDSVSEHFATQAQLQTLLSNTVVFQSQVSVINNHLDNCISETLDNPYPHPNLRAPYTPGQYFPYVHSVSGTALPAPDEGFLPSYVDWKDNPSGGDIDISFGGVNISGTEPLDIFEAALQVIY